MSAIVRYNDESSTRQVNDLLVTERLGLKQCSQRRCWKGRRFRFYHWFVHHELPAVYACPKTYPLI